MNVTVEDIRGITPGSTKDFYCDSPEKLRSAQALVTYCNRIKRPQRVWKYTTKSNWDKLTLTITAISIDGIKTNENVGRDTK